MSDLTKKQSETLGVVKKLSVASSDDVAGALSTRVSRSSLWLRQLEALGLVELTFTKINRSKAMAHARLTQQGIAA